jgi:penicillin-binding protein 2
LTEGKAGVRLRVLAGLVLAMFAALTTRLWFLQVLAAEQSRRAAQSNAVRLVETPARRGEIRDASGEPLVESRQSLVLTINRQEVGASKEDVLYRLSQLLDIPAAELGERLDSNLYYPFSPVPVAIDVPEKVVLYVREHALNFPGVALQKLPVRSYPLGNAAAHVLGYLGEISAEELGGPAFADYQAGDVIGKTGVEAVYEHDLVGTPGIEKYLVNSIGEDLRLIGRQDPLPGDDVYLTLDADTQRLAEESLRLGMQHARTVFDEDSAKYLLANAGAVVVMNPDTGGIEAMASLPTFQPSLFTRRMSNSEFERRFGAANGFPLLNRAIAGQYPPGSTYKPMIALAALSQPREGQPNQTVLSTEQGYGCPPSWTVPFDEDNPEAIQYVFNNWTSANLGFMSVARSLAESCDTVYYPAGYEYWKLFYPPPWDDGVEGNDDLPAREPLQKDLRALGFDHPTNVDLPFEEEGRVPTAVWKRDIHRENPEAFPFGQWVPGDFVLMSIGQGDTLVTPLQLAAAYSAIMNDGRACTPHVLDRVVDGQTGADVRRYPSQCRAIRAFDQADVAYVREALTGTLRSGTAAGAFSGFPFTQVWVAGKTGTAEVDPRQDYSWFAAMAESQGERHVVVVLVEQGGHGSTTAAPIARHIIEGLYGLEYSWTSLGEVPQVAGTD